MCAVLSQKMGAEVKIDKLTMRPLQGTCAMEGLTPLQRAVLEPPYATRLERPLVTASAAAEEDGATEVVRHLRSEAKKEHDRQTLGTAYF